MNIIKGLIKKDLYNLVSYKTSILIIVIFICVLSIFSSGMINYIPIIICTIIGMIALSTFSYDEMAKSDKFILSIPTNRREIIKAKYILSIGATILGGILGIVITIIMANIINYVRPENAININYDSLISYTIGGMFGISLIQAIQIPSIYKWGAEKGRIQMFILLFILVAAVSGVVYLIVKSNINVELLKSFIDRFGLFILISFIVIMYFVSFKISCRIYEKQEN